MPGKRDLGRLQGEIQELLADLWQVPRVAGLRHGFRPPADCFRTQDPPQVVVIVDIGGVEPERVRIVADERTLVISGERTRPPAAERPSYRQMEIDYGPFQRLIPIDEDIDPEGATASYEHGLLTIVLPVAQKAPPGRIAIEVRARG